METLIRVLETALPVFITLFIGMLCRSKNILTRAGVDQLKSVAVNICLPMVLVSSFATAEYTKNSITVPLVIFALCCVALAVGLFAVKLFKVQGKLTHYLFTGFEAGMLGYGLFALLFKNEPNSHFAIIDLGQVLFVFTVYKILLSGKAGLKNVAREALSSPVLWGIIIGLIIGATGLYDALKPSGVSGIFDSITSFISAPTSVLILISIGYDLVPGEIRWKKTAAIVVMRFAIMAIMLGVALLVNKFLLGGAMHVGALVLMFILPPPYVLPVFADAQEERANISSALSVTTLVSIILFAVMSAVI
ncbi:MAG: hypothetical protein J6J78_00890 [Clostridia bacterium]|nr:hypothetical protein [Clostridia bacterium]MBP3651611.1 hypothetical protein [Clostridia bacterium]